jgi:hypothetical protein
MIPDYVRLEGNTAPHPAWMNIFLLHPYWDWVEHTYFTTWQLQNQMAAIFVGLAIICLFVYYKNLNKR